MAQGSNDSPGWFVKAINVAIKDLEQVVAYLDDMIVLDSDTTCLLYTSPSPRDLSTSRMPSSA